MTRARRGSRSEPPAFGVRAPTDGLNGTTMGGMNSASGDMTLTSPGLVPELLITDLATSLNFWVTLCGFEILYDRPKGGFARSSLWNGAHHARADRSRSQLDPRHSRETTRSGV